MLKTLTILQKSQEPSFWDKIDYCFVSMCKFGSFNNLFAMITSLTELQIQNLDSLDLFCQYKEKKDFYELWQQHKQLKTMEMGEA